jgi:hypothetical protein
MDFTLLSPPVRNYYHFFPLFPLFIDEHEAVGGKREKSEEIRTARNKKNENSNIMHGAVFLLNSKTYLL